MYWSKKRPTPFVPRAYLTLPGYKPIKQVAFEQGLSEKRILQLIQQQRLPAIKCDGRYLIPEEAPIARRPHGRVRTKPRQWHRYVAGAVVHTWTIEVRAFAGQADVLASRLNGLFLDQHFLFAGTMQRYLVTDQDDPHHLLIILIWKDTDLPEEVSLEQDIVAFRAAFADLLDWETSTLTKAHALAYT